MVSVQLSNIQRKMRCFIQHSDPRKYWKYRNDVPLYRGNEHCQNSLRNESLYIKRCHAFNNASLGTHIGFGAEFRDRPLFPHGL